MLLTELFESVTVNKTLNPRLWSEGELDPKVREHLLKIAEHFRDFLGVELDISDITITGSNANYTWTAFSDLDLHLVTPGTPTDEQRELYSAKKSLWSAEHDIHVRGLPVECYVQGQAEPHHSTGVYSLVDRKWLVEPRKVQPRVNDSSVQAKFQDLARQARQAIVSGDLAQVEQIKQRITTMRRAGLERAGEWSVENLVFKELRNAGVIDSLQTRIRELEDQELSLENRR